MSLHVEGPAAGDLSHVPFAQRVAMQRDGRSRAYDEEAAQAAIEANRKRGRAKKAAAGAPAVLSTKVRVSRVRVAVGAPPRVKPRDPRFDGLSGALDRASFHQSYGFVRELQHREIADLEALLASESVVDATEKEAVRAELLVRKQRARDLEQQQMEHELAARVKVRETRGEREALTANQAKVRKQRQPGGQPVRPRRAETKQMELEERYRMLEERHQLQGYLSRKRKKGQQRNKKAIPVSARSAAE